MSENEEKPTKKPQYTSEYYNYHRNTMVLFLLAIVVTLPGVTLKIDGLGPIKSESGFLTFVVPFALWVAALYHWMLFHAEWKECAEPHRTQLEDALASVDAELKDLAKGYRDISSNLEQAQNLLENYSESAIKIKVERAIHNILEKSVLRHFEKANNISMQIATVREEQLRDFPDKINILDSKMQEALVDHEGNITHDAAQKIADVIMNITYIAEEYYRVFSDIANYTSEDARQWFMETTQYAESLNVAEHETDRQIGLVAINASSISQSVAEYQKRADTLGSLVTQLQKFTGRKRTFVWAKTDLAGVSIPVVFCVIATAGMLYHYISMMQRWLLTH